MPGPETSVHAVHAVHAGHADGGLRLGRISFWRGYLMTGFAVQVAETLVVAGYLDVSPRMAHRTLLLLVTVGLLAASIAGAVTVPFVASKPWRARFSLIWSVTSIAIVAVFASIEGGIESPLMYLLVLPMVYATVGLTAGQVGLCAVAEMTATATVGLMDRDVTASTGSVVILSGVVTGVTALGIVLTRYRCRLEHQQHLVLAELSRRVVTDGLTGCATNRAFHERLEMELSRAVRYGRPLSLLVCDVDGFKRFNDSFGHLQGDDTLAAIGEVLLAEARDGDYVGRIGGDEFAVILPETTIAHARRVAERVTGAVGDLRGPSIGLSIGVASLDTRIDTAEELFRRADQDMYTLKRTRTSSGG